MTDVRHGEPASRRGRRLLAALALAFALVACGSSGDPSAVRRDRATTTSTEGAAGSARARGHALGESAAGPGQRDAGSSGAGSVGTDPSGSPRSVTSTTQLRSTSTTLPPTTTSQGCQVGMPLSNTTTLTTGGSAAGRAVDRRGVGLMIGHSNGAKIFPEFIRQAAAVSDFPWVMAAQPGQDSRAWATTDQPWINAATRLSASGWQPADVQVVIGVLSRRMQDPSLTAPLDQYRDQDLPAILHRLEATYPNLRLVYIEARESGRFSPATNGEPGAYRHTQRALQFAANYHGRATVVIGPYLWDDGLCLRSDGLRTTRTDFETDGIHPSRSGAMKYGAAMVAYFRTHPSATPWFPRE